MMSSAGCVSVQGRTKYDFRWFVGNNGLLSFLLFSLFFFLVVIQSDLTLLVVSAVAVVMLVMVLDSKIKVVARVVSSWLVKKVDRVFVGSHMESCHY